MKSIAIFGAGNGALAAAAHLSLSGFRVVLCHHPTDHLEPIINSGAIKIKGVLGEQAVPINKITDDIGEAVRSTQFLMVVVPAIFHQYWAKGMAKHLTDDHIILLNPGSTGGALNFAKMLREESAAKVPICETSSLTYCCRIAAPGEVNIFNLSPNLKVAVFPGKEMGRVLPVIREAYPSLVPAKNVLETSLSNLNAVIHPPGMILNAGWIQRTDGDLYYYYEGTTPAVAEVMRGIDKERVRIMEAFGLKAVGFIEMFYETGYTSKRALDEDSFYIAFQESEADRWIRSPATLEHRFLDEDLRCGLVPMSEIGKTVNVDTPVMDALITLGGLVNGKDYRETGLTLAKMGVEAIDSSHLTRALEEGF
ncbi:NAD/NADP octopine/nopaline dehydrogenase family protein [Chloroflexota bacterium]